VSVIVSLLLPIYFTGLTSFVAISPDQVSIESTFGTNGNRIQFYGSSDDIDRILSIAESNEVVDYMVDRFDLYNVYDIDSSKQKGPVYVRQEFMSRYEIERTPRDILELAVEDANPRRAAEMANAARDRIDDINLALIRATHRRNATGLQQEVSSSEALLEELNARLAAIRAESGVYDTKGQREVLATTSSSLDQRLANTEARLAAFRQQGLRDSIRALSVNLIGLQKTRSSLDEQLERLNANVSQIESLEEERLRANESLTENRTRLKQYTSILTGDRRTIEVLEVAHPPLVKSWPIRWLIVVVSTVLSFLFAVAGVLLLESARRYDWQSITR
jgi:capsule polysaccharide export protein KpsE/RkpR